MPTLLHVCLRLGHSREDALAIEGDLFSEIKTRRTHGSGGWALRVWFVTQVLSSIGHGVLGRAHHAARMVWFGGGDLKLVLRALRRQPAATFVMVATLALGIGANTLGYSVLHALLLSPLPVTHEESLVVVREIRLADEDSLGGVSYLNVDDWRTQSAAFSGLAIVSPDQANIRTRDAVIQAEGLTVSSSLFSVLGVPPAMGTTFETWGDFGQTSSGAWPIMLTHRGWQRLFAADPAIIGRTIEVDGQVAEVVGITPRGLFPVTEEPIDYWATPAALGSASDPSSTNGSRTFRGYTAAVGRLRPGTSLEAAQMDLERVNGMLAQTWPQVFAGRRVQVDPLRATLAHGSATAAWMVAGLAGLVWLLTCANAINLQLARATARARDVGVRRALGGTRADLIRPFLLENIVIAVAAGGIGFALARVSAAALLPWLPSDVPSLPGLIPGATGLAASVVLSLVTGLMCGVGPAWLVTRGSAQFLIGDRSHTMLVPAFVRNALLGAQVALALTLLAGGGLLLGSLYRQLVVPSGFSGHDVWTTRVSLPARYSGIAASTQALTDLRESLRAIPGVDEVAFSQSVPFTGLDNSTRVGIIGAITADSPSTQLRFITPEYLQVLQIPVVAGRGFTRTDTSLATPVVLVNVAFATTHYGAPERALGRVVTLGWGGTNPKQSVGVVGDVRHAGPSSSPVPEAYVPHTQFANTTMSALIRVRPGRTPGGAAIHDAITRVEPGLARQAVRTLDSYRDERLATPRLAATVFAGFAGLALTLAVVGVYGMVNYLTTVRTREIGVRLALGASHMSVFALVVRQVLGSLTIGLIAGVGMALIAGRALTPWLYGVTAGDPATLVTVSVVLTVTALAAAVPPARRATRIDPARTLRSAD